MIIIKKLTKIYKSYGIETKALDNIYLNIDEGDFIAIMGTSGCGKSTLLNILGLLDKPSSGELNFIGKDIQKLSEFAKSNLRKNIGFIFQNFNLIDELTNFQNIEMPLVYLRMGKRERTKIVNEIIDYTGLRGREELYPQQLSGGEQQRVAVARAVVSKPKILLADEPTGNLDSKNSDAIMELLGKLNEDGNTVLMVTHSKENADKAKQIINMKDGKIVTE